MEEVGGGDRKRINCVIYMYQPISHNEHDHYVLQTWLIQIKKFERSQRALGSYVTYTAFPLLLMLLQGL